MRVVVTGKSGQVVTSLREYGKATGHEVIALGRPEMDLTDVASIADALQTVAPDVIVSAAAYTAVDKAEDEANIAYAINRDGVAAVARAAKARNVPLVHISTDYVFDGSLDRPYRETDSTKPASAYGASKLAGEQAVLAEYRNSAILRTAWVYSPFGNNFVRTMLRLAGDRDEIAVVADQIGNPTSALDISHGILMVAANLIERDDDALRGVFHMAACGEANWADFARAIFAASAVQHGPFAHIKSISAADYPTLATRPANSRLDCGLIKRVHGVALPDWRASLGAVVARLQTVIA